MKHYKSYTAKKFKLPRRIIFFTVIAVLIFAAAVITGNILKRKVDNNDIDTTPVTEPVSDTSKQEGGEGEKSVDHDASLAGVNAAYLDLSAARDAEGARQAVKRAYDGGYNAVLFAVYGEDMMLKYASPAAQSASGITASDTLVPYTVLQEAVSAAGSYGMKCVAAVNRDGKMLSEVAAELSDAGFDEILVRGFEGLEALNGDSVSEISKCITDVRKGSVRVGVSLSADIYLAAQNSPYIEKLYLRAEYLAIDMTGFGAEAAAETAAKLQGSFSAYMLRPVLDGSNAETASAVKAALSENGVNSAAYISAPPVSDGGDDSDGGDNGDT